MTLNKSIKSWWLSTALDSMASRRETIIMGENGEECRGIVAMIQAEDGSGNKFNVKIGERTVFVRFA